MYLCRRVLFHALGRQSHLFRYSLTFNATLNSEMFKAIILHLQHNAYYISLLAPIVYTSILLHTCWCLKLYSKSTSVNANCVKGKIDQERMRKVIQRINREKAASAFIYDIGTFQET